MNNNGYCQIEISGEKLALKFGLPCISRLEEKSKTLTDQGLWTAYLLYYGYLNNCLLKEVEPEKDLEFFADYVDLSLVDDSINVELLKVIGCFNDSRFVKGLQAKNGAKNETAKKKNSTKKK